MILSGIVFVFFYASQQQKTALIDQYILLKFTQQGQAYPYYVLVCILTLYFFTIKYYRDRLQLKDERIKDLEKLLPQIKEIKKKEKDSKKS